MHAALQNLLGKEYCNVTRGRLPAAVRSGNLIDHTAAYSYAGKPRLFTTKHACLSLHDAGPLWWLLLFKPPLVAVTRLGASSQEQVSCSGQVTAVFPVPAVHVPLQVMDSVGCVYTVEIYTETPRTEEGKAELQLLQAHIPGSVALVSADLAWSWQMMATADVLVMSNSAFSLSAALLNPDAFNVFFPNAKQSQFRVPLKHWVMPLDRNGTLSQADVDRLRARLGGTSQPGQETVTTSHLENAAAAQHRHGLQQ